jgi:hypothetical protein
LEPQNKVRTVQKHSKEKTVAGIGSFKQKQKRKAENIITGKHYMGHNFIV